MNQQPIPPGEIVTHDCGDSDCAIPDVWITRVDCPACRQAHTVGLFQYPDGAWYGFCHVARNAFEVVVTDDDADEPPSTPGFRAMRVIDDARPRPERKEFRPPQPRKNRMGGRDDLDYDTFLNVVVASGRAHGWLVDTIVDGKLHQDASPGGAPIVMVQPKTGMVIFAYLKCGNRRVRKDECPWLNALQYLSDRTVDWMLEFREGDPMPMDGRRVRVYLWRPGDLEEIGRILRGIPADFSDWEDWGPTAGLERAS